MLEQKIVFKLKCFLSPFSKFEHSSLNHHNNVDFPVYVCLLFPTAEEISRTDTDETDPSTSSLLKFMHLAVLWNLIELAKSKFERTSVIWQVHMSQIIDDLNAIGLRHDEAVRAANNRAGWQKRVQALK